MSLEHSAYYFQQSRMPRRNTPCCEQFQQSPQTVHVEPEGNHKKAKLVCAYCSTFHTWTRTFASQAKLQEHQELVDEMIEVLQLEEGHDDYQFLQSVRGNNNMKPDDYRRFQKLMLEAMRPLD